MEDNSKGNKTEKSDFYAHFISNLQHQKSMNLRTAFVK